MIVSELPWQELRIDGVAFRLGIACTALLLARWRQLHDARADAGIVEDRILRRVTELRAGRGYVAALQARQAARFATRLERAANDAEVLATLLDRDAA